MSRSGPVPPGLANGVLALAATLGALAGLETFARVFDLGGDDPIADYIASWDERWGSQFYVFGPGPDINADGLRDVEHRVANPEARRRLVILGDSVAFGFKLGAHQSFPAVLRRLLAKRNESTEVFNVALPGWTIRQQRIAYASIARKYRPDRVLVAICLNDIPEMQNNLSKPSPLLTAVYRRSHVVRFVLGAQLRDIHQVGLLFRAPDAPAVQNGWRLFFDEILELRERVRGDGATLALMVLPFRLQVMPDAPEPIPQRRIEEFSRQQGIPHLDLLPRLQKLGAAAFLDYDHLSPRGAVVVARALLASGLVPVEAGAAE